MSGVLRKAYRDLTKRRLRSLLTLAGIVVGVAGIVAIVSTSRNLVRAQEAAYRNASQADVTYWTWDAPATLERALEALPNVAEAELRTTLYTKWQVKGTWRDLYLIGVQDFGQVEINRMALREGRYPDLDELLVEASVQEITPLAVGQEVAVRDRFGQERIFTISGFAQSPAFLSSALTNFAVAYAPAVQVRRMVGIAGSNQVLIKLADFRQRNETLQEIERLFAKRGLPHGEPQVRDPVNYLGKRELDSLMRVMFLFSALGLALSGFLVANTLSAIVAEGVSEMGVMKALGATRSQVLGTYLLTAILYGLGGTALGLILGAVGGWRLLARIGQLGNVEVAFQVAPEGLALGVLVGLGVTLLAGLPPAWAGTAIPVKEALDSYGITSTYGQGRLDRLLKRISGLPPVAAMAVRNLARRKARNTITLLVVALATAGLLAAQSTNASVNRAIQGVFATYNADAWIWFAEPVGKEFAGMIRAVDEVREVEAWSLADAWV
ncbi:MAG TPA: ABC transporter permease, partial [Anaerolineae bacterium]|nr:ABC transporter permease [Anaerolineae bacterium]